MWAGMASIDRMTSGPIASENSKSAIQRFTDLVADGVFDRLQDVVRLRENRVFQLRRIGDRRVERADATDGRVEILKQLVGDTRSDFRPEPARHLILVRDDDPARFLDERRD